MRSSGTCCLVCFVKFSTVFDLKKHLRTTGHKDKAKEIFQDAEIPCVVTLPHIAVVDKSATACTHDRLVGLSALTLCFSRKSARYFYLCHICEDKPPAILKHLLSSDHCSNYFSHTNPNSLIFSWLPSMNMSVDLKPALKKEVGIRGSGYLQILDLPQKLFEELEILPYSKVMYALRENDKLEKLIEAAIPKRTTIQTFKDDSNREHPLLGLQHLVECVNVRAPEQRYYLCTVCKITGASHKVTKHMLSLDHIHCYFKLFHPSTLLSRESYIDYKSFAPMILDLAKKEEMQNPANEWKRVSLEPDEYASVISLGYSEALKKVENAIREQEKISAIASVKPEKTLESPTVGLLYKIRCQNCSTTFEDTSKYFDHLTTDEHKGMLKRYFGEDRNSKSCGQTGCKPKLSLYEHVHKCYEENQPAVGAPLVVACVTSGAQARPIYLCFACEERLTDTSVQPHLKTTDHLINTLLYQNPWHLPFAWRCALNVNDMWSKAWKYEKEREAKEMTLKVLDIAPWIFNSLKSSYSEVMRRLNPWGTLLKGELPLCNTLCKPEQKEKFPLLGQQFVVIHEAFSRHRVRTRAQLCLLCTRTLTDQELTSHVFSWEHVAAFLDQFHPGSVNPQTDAETLLDLAEQAGSIHVTSDVQVIELDPPITLPCFYHSAIKILGHAKRRAGLGQLKPPVMPMKMLVPRKTAQQEEEEEEDQKNKAIAAEEEVEVKPCQESAKEEDVGTAESVLGLDSVTVSSDSDDKQEMYLWQYMQRKNRKPVIGLNAILECNCNEHDPIYYCGCCSLKVTLADLISHIIGPEHQKKYLMSLRQLTPLPETDELKTVGHFAALLEQDEGCGEPQVIDVEEEIYNIISKQDFESGIQLVKASTPELCGVQTVDTAPTLHPKHGPSSLPDKCQVVDMETESDQDEKQPTPVTAPAPASVMTQNTSRAQSPLQPNDQVTITQIPVCNSHHEENAFLSVYKSNENTNVVSTYGTNTTPSDPDSTGLDSRVEVTDVASTLKLDSQNTSKDPKTANASQPPEADEMTEESDNCKHVDASAQTAPVIKSPMSSAVVPPNNHKGHQFAAPHLQTSLMTAKPENKNPPPKLSCTSTSETQPGQSQPTVGLNQLVKVRCQGRKQIYCQLCRIKLKSSEHVVSYDHQLNYVKMKFPNLSPTPDQLEKIVVHLAEAEKGIGPLSVQEIEVNMDTYRELASLPEHNALERVQEMLKRRDSRVMSFPTNSAEAMTDKCAITSPCEVTTPDEELGNKQVFLTQLGQIPGNAGRISQTPDTCQDTTDRRQYQHMSTMKVQHVPKQPGRVLSEVHRASRIPIKENKEVSNLSSFLKVKGVEGEVIGLGSVWECQGIGLASFFLCESCQQTLSISNICQHLVSFNHLLNYMIRAYRKFMLMFWWEKDLPLTMKKNLLMEVAHHISEREHFNRMDAQCIQLKKDLHECVRKAPFSEALKMLQVIKENNPKKLAVSCQAVSAPQQKKAREEAHEQHLQETMKVGDLNGDKQMSPLNGTSVSSKTDSVVSTVSGTGANPQESFKSFSMRTQPTSAPASQHQRPTLEMPVHQPEVNSQIPSSCVSPTISPTLSEPPADISLPTRKRTAVTPTDTLTSTDDPKQCTLPAKRACITNQPDPKSSSKSTLDQLSTTSTLTSPADENTGSEHHDSRTEDRIQLADLIALVREKKSSMSLPDNTTCSSDLSNSGVGRRYNPNVPNTKNRSQDPCTVMTRVQKKQPSLESFKEEYSVPPPEDDHSSSEDDSFKSSAAGTAQPPDLQQKEVVKSHSTSGNVSQVQTSDFVHFGATVSNTDQRPQPQDNTGCSSTDVGQLAIGAIVTARPEPPKQRKQATYSTATTAAPTVTVAASAVYGQYSQSYLPSEAVVGYTTPNPPVCNGSFYPHAGCTPWMYYPSQMYPNYSQPSLGHPSVQASSSAWASFDFRQQILTQQYYSAAPLAPAHGSVATEAAPLHTAQYDTTQNNPQVVPYCPPTTSTASSTVNATHQC